MILILLAVALLVTGIVMTMNDYDGFGIPMAVVGGAAFIGMIFVMAGTHAEAPSNIAKHAYLSDLSKKLPSLGAAGEDAIGEIVKFNSKLAEFRAWNRGLFDIFIPDIVCDLPIIEVQK